MMRAPPRLALGTVQFGLAYGVAGREVPVPEDDVRRILRRAWDLGIRTLDTAAAYGSIEERLAPLMGAAEFEVVSKLPALPVDAGLQDCVDIALAAVERSRRRLGPRLKALMFHRAEDLLSGHGPGLWAALAPLCGDAGIAVGVSCYDPATLANVASRFDVEVAQLPGNAFDQAVVSAALPDRIRIHVRSLFLQGLLLMPLAQARQRVPAAAEALRRWHDWCEDRSLAPLQAALGVVKDWPGVELCVVGVESVAQLEQIAEAWDAAEPLSPPGLAQSEADVTDPRRWPQREPA